MQQNKSRISLWKVGVTVFISMMLANLITLGIVWLYMEKENKVVITEIEHPVTPVEKIDTDVEEQRRREIEQDRQQNAQRIRERTCEFWRAEVEKENTERNRLLMAKACND